MTMMRKMLAGGAAVAALAAAAPAAAQYGYPYGYGTYNPYGTSGYNPYAPSAYGYANTQYMTQVAAQRCSAAVQQRLQTRAGLSGVVSALMGVPTQARVVGITQVNPRRSTVRVRGLATSGRYASYSPWGIGAYGSAGYAHQPDLSFRCDVDYRGYVRNIDIDRRF